MTIYKKMLCNRKKACGGCYHQHEIIHRVNSATSNVTAFRDVDYLKLMWPDTSHSEERNAAISN